MVAEFRFDNPEPSPWNAAAFKVPITLSAAPQGLLVLMPTPPVAFIQKLVGVTLMKKNHRSQAQRVQNPTRQTFRHVALMGMGADG